MNMTRHIKKKNRGPVAALAGAVALLAIAIVTSVLVRVGPPAALTDAHTSEAVTLLAHQDGRGQLAQLTANPDCTLKVPKNPLTAKGLATPYVLQSAGMTCAETDQNLAAFVQAIILDPVTGQLAVFDPVVSDANTAATPPAVPNLLRRDVIAIWTGFNGNVLKLVGPGHNQFVNFAQQAYANSPGFFAALRQAIARGLVTVPALGTSPADGMACPTVRDFSVVDQDQSDNVPVAYGAPFGVSNGSDDDLLTLIDTSLRCTPWPVPLLDPGVTISGATVTTAGPLEEVQAALMQPAPAALVPGLDPFVTLAAQPDLFFQDLYRLQVGQPLTFNDHDTTAYCQNLAAVGEPRLKADAAIEAGFPAPVFAQIGTNLANVLAGRFAATWMNLTCQALTGQPSPIAVTTDPATRMITSATYGAAATATPTVTPTGTATTTAPATDTTTPATDTTTPAPDVTTTTPAPDVTSTGSN